MLDLRSLKKAVEALKIAFEIYDQNPLAEYLPEKVVLRDGVIQRFEFTFELSWKMLKRYLEEFGLEKVDGLNNRDLFRVGFEQGDALTWPAPTGVFDLVVTHFFLYCFRRDELEGLVAKDAASATSDACWLLADIRLPERGWQRWRARVVLALMYGFFRCATGLSASRLTPPDDFLEAAGFRLADQRLVNYGLTHSDLWLRTQA